jgi:hypothetical protein
MRTEPITLGNIIGTRQFSLYAADGEQRLVTVSVGAPILLKTEDVFRCPVQIVGLGCDKRIYGIFGEDAFVALQYAFDFIGQILDDKLKGLGLVNRNRRDGSTRESWIWQFGTQPDESNFKDGAGEPPEKSALR